MSQACCTPVMIVFPRLVDFKSSSRAAVAKSDLQVIQAKPTGSFPNGPRVSVQELPCRDRSNSLPATREPPRASTTWWWMTQPPLRSHGGAAAGFDHHFDLFPDGCIDIVFEGGALSVLVPGIERRRARVAAQARVVGVRVRCGWGAAVLGRSLAGCAGHKRPLGPDALELSQTLVRLADDRERALALAEHIEARLERRVRPPESLLDFIQSISAREAIVDRPVTSRALYDSCTRHVGVAPAALRRLMRFQTFLGRLPKTAMARDSLAEAAGASSFADQAHLNRECIRIAGRTPGQLRAAFAR